MTLFDEIFKKTNKSFCLKRLRKNVYAYDFTQNLHMTYAIERDLQVLYRLTKDFNFTCIPKKLLDLFFEQLPLKFF